MIGGSKILKLLYVAGGAHKLIEIKKKVRTYSECIHITSRNIPNLVQISFDSFLFYSHYIHNKGLTES